MQLDMGDVVVITEVLKLVSLLSCNVDSLTSLAFKAKPGHLLVLPVNHLSNTYDRAYLVDTDRLLLLDLVSALVTLSKVVSLLNKVG